MEQNSQLLKVAADYAGDIDAHCTDVTKVIFPSAKNPPSDAIINAVSAKLRSVIRDIEFAISGNDKRQIPKTWEIMARSGFLREPDIIDFILSRVSEDRLKSAIAGSQDKFVIGLLDHANVSIADAAQRLLAAESLHHPSAGQSYLRLSPELLHKMCWRVVAALEVIDGVRRPQMIATAKSIIADYSESNRSQSAARKIVHFMGDAERSAFLDPCFAGFHFHIAALSNVLDLDQDHVVRLIDSGSSTPYAIMLAGAEVAKANAVKAIYAMRGDVITLQEAGLLDADYDALAPELVKTEISKWAATRTHYLTFGQP